MANDNWRTAETISNFFEKAATWLGGAGFVSALFSVPPLCQPYQAPSASWLWLPGVLLGVAGVCYLIDLAIPVNIPEEELERRRSKNEAKKRDDEQQAKWENSLEHRLALAKSTDTNKDKLRALAQNDASAEVRRSAIETLALLRQAGL